MKLTVDEVEHLINETIAELPADIVGALDDVQVFVAASRGDVAVLRAAVTASGEKEVAIPADFRALFLGEPLPPHPDDDDPDPEPVSGVIVFNAAMLRDAEDVVFTLFHEIGHALGLDEDEVAALGLK